jgi:hypothetical protein
MKPPVCRLLAESKRYLIKSVRSIRYDFESLTIDIQGEGVLFGHVVFDEPLGFRVLDERDLNEFWDTYHEGTGWLYEVKEGGWKDLENARGGFVSSIYYPELREYLVVDNTCVSCCH